MLRRGLLLLLCLGLLWLPGARALAAPSVQIDSAPLPGNRVAYDVSIVYDDPGMDFSSGLEPAIFTARSGPFLHLQFGGADVDEDADAALFDGMGGYEAALDSWFYTEQFMAQLAPITGGDPASDVFTLPQASLFRVTDLQMFVAHLVLPEGELFDYDLTVAFEGDLIQLVPEPEGAALSGACLLTLAALARRPSRRAA
jgi:hypothetical protein